MNYFIDTYFIVTFRMCFSILEAFAKLFKSIDNELINATGLVISGLDVIS